MNKKKTYYGFIAIVDRPNVDKSALLSSLLRQKISITSRKAQTTRHRIVNIRTEGTYQAAYADTPDLHTEGRRAINHLMGKAVSSSISDVELIVFVVEGTRQAPNDEMVLNRLHDDKASVILAVSKIDNVQEKADLLPYLQFLVSQVNFLDIALVSAETGSNVDTVAGIMCKRLPKAIHHFPRDYITDRSQRFMASGTVHERLMRFLGIELPYSVTVRIERFISDERGGYNVNDLILVKRKGQKEMVVGNKGARIKTAGIEARKDIQEMFEAPVHLRLWVRVKSGWADDEYTLRSLGYDDDVQTHPLKHDEYMEGWQRAFILYSCPWSETSLMLDTFIEELGRVRLAARGARSEYSNLKGALQPFTPLLLRFGGRGEIKTLRSAEAVSLALSFSRVTLYSGLYTSGLISRVLEYETRLPVFFFGYLDCIQALAGAMGSPEPALRHFELALPGYLGYGVGSTHCTGSGKPIDDTMTYRYREEKRFITSVVIDNVTSTGYHLEALESREFPGVDTLRTAKRFTRMALRPYLGGKPLRSRELFRQFMPKRK